MIPELGHFALIVALCIAVAQGTLPLWGAASGNRRLMALARPAAQGQFVFVAIAFGCLAWSFVHNDFSVVNVATGLATTEPELEDVLRALGASKLDIMRKVGIPRSLPYFFGSLKVAITLAFVGAVVSETVGANKGIGKLMLDAQASFQVQIVFAGLLVLAFLGIVLYAATALIEKRYTGWAFRGGTNR